MNDTEEAARHLFAVATEDIPAGIDLLGAIPVRRRKRTLRLRAAVAAGAAGIMAAAAAITVSAVSAPSAFAQVTHAASQTAAESYTVRSVEKVLQAGGLRSVPWTTADGQFNPARGLGEVADNQGYQVRFTGGYTYVSVTGALRAAYHLQGHPIPAWASWIRLPIALAPGAGVTAAGLATLGDFPSQLAVADPQDLLSLLQSATAVREVGPASGPGWTGTAYAFSIATKLSGPWPSTVSITGTVDVDQQGRVRQLDAQETFRSTVQKVEITFGDFGVPVSVSPPPASQTYIPS
jgi:hypothetical protein